MALTTETLDKRITDIQETAGSVNTHNVTPDMLALQMSAVGNVVMLPSQVAGLAEMMAIETAAQLATQEMANHFSADAFNDFDAGSIKDVSASYVAKSAEEEEEEEKKRLEDIADGIERAFEESVMQNTVITIGGKQMTAARARDIGRFMRDNNAEYMRYLKENNPDLYAKRMANPTKYEELDRQLAEARTPEQIEQLVSNNPEYGEMIAAASENLEVGKINNAALDKGLNSDLRSQFSMAVENTHAQTVSVDPVRENVEPQANYNQFAL